MRRTCAILQAIYLLKVMFRWIQLFAITGERCNDDFMLNLVEIMPYFWSFSFPIVRVDRRKIKQK